MLGLQTTAPGDAFALSCPVPSKHSEVLTWLPAEQPSPLVGSPQEMGWVPLVLSAALQVLKGAREVGPSALPVSTEDAQSICCAISVFQ